MNLNDVQGSVWADIGECRPLGVPLGLISSHDGPLDILLHIVYVLPCKNLIIPIGGLEVEANKFTKRLAEKIFMTRDTPYSKMIAFVKK